MRGFVFNIQRFSINDGPGIRTTVFLKGCNLQCQWCHNPESIKTDQEIQYFGQKCVRCGKCVEVCPTTAIYMNPNGEKIFDRSKCNQCGLCIEHCLYGALSFVAQYMEADEVVSIIKKDEAYYQNSGGGLTISGGEPLLQKDFVKEVFSKTRRAGIHNALDTAANVSWACLEEVLPLTDLVLLDLKVMDPEEHKKVTGSTNKQILENAVKLSQVDVDMIVRIPVIPGINNTDENMSKAADFLRDFQRLLFVELLPYHDLGVDKYLSLGEEKAQGVFEIPKKEEMERLAYCFRKRNIAVKIQ